MKCLLLPRSVISCLWLLFITQTVELNVMRQDDLFDYMVCDSEGLMKGRAMKKCSMCAEEVQNEAIKCKHCGSMLNIADCISTPEVQAPSPSIPSGIVGVGCWFLVILGTLLLIATVIFTGANLFGESSFVGWMCVLGMGAVSFICLSSVWKISMKMQSRMIAKPADEEGVKKRTALRKFFQSWQFLLIVFVIWLGARLISNAQNECGFR